jgi:cystathionine beta-lyase
MRSTTRSTPSPARQAHAATRLVWLEAAGSVTLEFPDLLGLIAGTREAAPQAVIALDNTWGCGIAFDAFALPHGLAVDLSVHALTKYPSGGGDVLMGSVCTRDSALFERLAAAARPQRPGRGRQRCGTGAAQPAVLAAALRGAGRRLRAASPSGRAICRA